MSSSRKDAPGQAEYTTVTFISEATYLSDAKVEIGVFFRVVMTCFILSAREK